MRRSGCGAWLGNSRGNSRRLFDAVRGTCVRHPRRYLFCTSITKNAKLLKYFFCSLHKIVHAHLRLPEGNVDSASHPLEDSPGFAIEMNEVGFSFKRC